jgi:hypothetical protein
MFTATLLNISAPAWTAIAAWVAIILALAAAAISLLQKREARLLREQQARPYVTAYLDIGPAGLPFVDLVIKSFGTTAAANIRTNFATTPQSAAFGGKEIWLPDPLSLLAPGQEWRCFWDSTYTRLSFIPQLPSKHTVTITFTNLRGKQFSDTFTLDWEPLTAQASIVTYGINDIAKTLHTIRDIMTSWKEPGGGLRAILDISGRKNPLRPSLRLSRPLARAYNGARRLRTSLTACSRRPS